MFRLRFRGVSITREGMFFAMVFVFILAGAIVRNLQLLMILAFMLVGPMMYNAWAVYRSLRSLRFSRRVPSLLASGENFFVEVKAENIGGSNSYAVVAKDQIEQIQGYELESAHSVDVFFAKIKARGDAASSYKAVITKRGRYRLGPLTSSTAFPLGMMRNTRIESIYTEFVVMPRQGTLTPAWRRLIQLNKTGFASSRRRHGLLEGDFYGLREWRSGDPKQWIHWRSSAKQGELVVRQFEKQNLLDFVLIVDAWIPAEATDEEKQRMERVISFAATAIRDLAAIGGSHVQLVCAGETVEEIAGNVSQSYFARAMELLAMMVPTRGDQIGSVLASTLRTSKPGSRVILLSSRSADISDSELFSTIWNDSKQRTELARVVSVWCGKGEDKPLFHLPQEEDVA